MNEVIKHPGLPLAHRLRPPQPGELAGAPCLLLLHGVGANEAGLAPLALQQDPRLAVILVRSPIRFGPMQFGFFQVSFGPSGPVINAGQADASRLQLAAFIERLPAVYGIDARRIWVAGFSQGGILSASVGLTRPDLVRGFGILSGRILPEIGPAIAPTQALATLSAYVSHGAEDDKLGIGFARSARDQLRGRGIEPVYHEYAAGHALTPEMQHDFGQWMAGELRRTGM